MLTTAKYAHDRLSSGLGGAPGYEVHEVKYLPWLAPASSGAGGAAMSPGLLGVVRGAAFRTIRGLTRRLRLGLGLFAEKTMLAYPPLVRAGVRLVRERKIDLVFSTCGPDVCPIAAARIARLTGVPWISDYRDLWFDEFAVFRYRVTTKFVTWMQANLMHRASLVSTVSRGFARYLEKIVPGKVTVCYNGFFEDRVLEEGERPAKDSQYLDIVHTGVFYPKKRDLKMFLEGMDKLARQGISLDRLRIQCYGPKEEWVTQMVASYGLGERFVFHGEVVYERSLAAQQSAHVLLYIDWMDDRAEGVLGGKLFEYLASGTPVLMTGLGEHTEAASILLRCAAGRVAIGAEAVADLLHLILEGRFGCTPDSLRVAEFGRSAQARALLSRAATLVPGTTPGRP